MPSNESIEELSSLKRSSCSIWRLDTGRRLSLLWCWSCFVRIRDIDIEVLAEESRFAFLLSYWTFGDLDVRVTGLHFVTLFSELVTKLWSLKFVLLEPPRVDFLDKTPFLGLVSTVELAIDWLIFDIRSICKSSSRPSRVRPSHLR